MATRAIVDHVGLQTNMVQLTHPHGTWWQTYYTWMYEKAVYSVSCCCAKANTGNAMSHVQSQVASCEIAKRTHHL